jgi:hypothetical protein
MLACFLRFGFGFSHSVAPYGLFLKILINIHQCMYNTAFYPSLKGSLKTIAFFQAA